MMKPYISTSIELSQINRRMEFIQLLDSADIPNIKFEKEVIFIGFESDDANSFINFLAFNLVEFLIDGHEPIVINVKYYNLLLDCDIIISEKIIYIKQATQLA